MSTQSFKVKSGLTLNPTDLATLANPQAGDLACDINDSNKIKRYDAASASWVEVGSGGGVGGVDIFFVQDFESASLSSFTQTGLVLSQTDPLKGKVSAVLNHQAGVSPANDQSFKQVLPVDRKFRGQTMVLRLDSKSDASQGNLVIKIYDETNSANIVASEQLQLSDDVNGKKTSVSFTIPESCASISYTITALPESGKVTRIDDIICEIAETALLETAVVVPVVTSQSSIASGALSAGSQYSGTFTTSGSAVYSESSGILTVLKEAVFNISFSATNSTTTTVIPAIEINGVAVSQDNSPAVASNNASSSYTGKLVAGTTISFQNNGPGNASSISISVSALCHETTTKTIPLTQSGLVQGGDTFLVAAGNAGQALTGSVTDMPFIFSSQKGSAVSFNGTQISILEEGTFIIDGSVFCTSSDNDFGLYLNGSRIKTIGGGPANTVHSLSYVGYHSVGDVLSIRPDSNLTLQNNTQYHYIHVSKQGSLKQVSVSSDQKIKIPTSELRFEGASSRGSTATAIVKFDTLAKLRGDAFTVESDAVLGTRITMKKAGRLSASAQVYNSSSASKYLYLTRNQAILTTVPANGAEVLAGSGTSATSSHLDFVSWTGDVAVGDIIRVVTSINPTATYENQFNLSFQEQDISVSVTNTLPQFSESDSCVQLTGANGYGSSATTTRRFSSEVQNIGTDIEYVDNPTLGGQFTVKTSGTYSISYTEASTANASETGAFIYRNGTLIAGDRSLLNSAVATGKYANPSWQGYLTSGDVITFGVTAAVNNNGAVVEVVLSKVGKPNVTGVDVTPFVNVPQPESQSSQIQLSGIATSSSDLSANIQVQQGSGLYAFSAGILTALKPIKIDVSASRTASFATVGNYIAVIDILKNGTLISRETNVTRDWYSGLGTSFAVSISSTVSLLAGETLNFSGTDTVTAGSVSSVTSRIQISATALSDQILTAPETFSTDTASLRYASSAAYTLSTLQNAPVGTFITFTYAANTNTRTQTTTRPTQTDADMNTNGIQIFTRAYNAASTAGNPAAIAIQIGKGFKGFSIAGYVNINKVEALSLDAVYQSDASRSGLTFKEYNENTGVLFIDAGYSLVSSNTSASLRSTDNPSIETSGYLVINASKNPALTGLNSETVSARVVNTAGTSIGSADTKIVFNSSASIVNNMTIDNANNRIYAPHTGIYWIDAGVQFASAAYTAGHQLQIKLYKNGVYYSTLAAKTVDAAVTQKQGLNGSDQIRLAKGDYIEFYASNARGATALSTTAGECYMNITKKGL